MPDFDQDAFGAALDLIGRTGANELEFGYLHEDVPVHLADWYANAKYHGARVTVEHHQGPVEALEALARRLLEGGLCAFCGLRIALSDFPGKRCRWTRRANVWVRGCEETHSERDPAIVEAGRVQGRGPKGGRS